MKTVPTQLSDSSILLNEDRVKLHLYSSASGKNFIITRAYFNAAGYSTALWTALHKNLKLALDPDEWVTKDQLILPTNMSIDDLRDRMTEEFNFNELRFFAHELEDLLQELSPLIRQEYTPPLLTPIDFLLWIDHGELQSSQGWVTAQDGNSGEYFHLFFQPDELTKLKEQSALPNNQILFHIPVQRWQAVTQLQDRQMIIDLSLSNGVQVIQEVNEFKTTDGNITIQTAGRYHRQEGGSASAAQFCATLLSAYAGGYAVRPQVAYGKNTPLINSTSNARPRRVRAKPIQRPTPTRSTGFVANTPSRATGASGSGLVSGLSSHISRWISTVNTPPSVNMKSSTTPNTPTYKLPGRQKYDIEMPAWDKSTQMFDPKIAGLAFDTPIGDAAESIGTIGDPSLLDKVGMMFNTFWTKLSDVLKRIAEGATNVTPWILPDGNFGDRYFHDLEGLQRLTLDFGMANTNDRGTLIAILTDLAIKFTRAYANSMGVYTNGGRLQQLAGVHLINRLFDETRDQGEAVSLAFWWDITGANQRYGVPNTTLLKETLREAAQIHFGDTVTFANHTLIAVQMGVPDEQTAERAKNDFLNNLSRLFRAAIQVKKKKLAELKLQKMGAPAGTTRTSLEAEILVLQREVDQFRIDENRIYLRAGGDEVELDEDFFRRVIGVKVHSNPEAIATMKEHLLKARQFRNRGQISEAQFEEAKAEAIAEVESLRMRDQAVQDVERLATGTSKNLMREGKFLRPEEIFDTLCVVIAENHHGLQNDLLNLATDLARKQGLNDTEARTTAERWLDAIKKDSQKFEFAYEKTSGDSQEFVWALQNSFWGELNDTQLYLYRRAGGLFDLRRLGRSMVGAQTEGRETSVLTQIITLRKKIEAQDGDERINSTAVVKLLDALDWAISLFDEATRDMRDRTSVAEAVHAPLTLLTLQRFYRSHPHLPPSIIVWGREVAHAHDWAAHQPSSGPRTFMDPMLRIRRLDQPVLSILDETGRELPYHPFSLGDESGITSAAHHPNGRPMIPTEVGDISRQALGAVAPEVFPHTKKITNPTTGVMKRLPLWQVTRPDGTVEFITNTEPPQGPDVITAVRFEGPLGLRMCYAHLSLPDLLSVDPNGPEFGALAVQITDWRNLVMGYDGTLKMLPNPEEGIHEVPRSILIKE